MNSSRALRRAAALLLLGACAAPELPPVEPALAPVGSEQPSDPDGAIELWGAWIEELSSDGFRARMADARAFAAGGYLEDVLELLDQASDELPPEPAIHAARAGILAEMGFPRAAELELERALVLAPDDGHLWWGLATVRERLGLVTKADEALQQARALASR